jgi:hypothetical protein
VGTGAVWADFERILRMSTKATILKAVRKYCVHTCCAEDQEYVKECPGSSINIGVFCPLHPYRMGSDPSPSISKVERGRESAKKNFFRQSSPKEEGK